MVTIPPPVSLIFSRDEIAFYREQIKDTLLKKHTVIKKSIIDYDIFLILSGALEVSINHQHIATLRAGMLVSELALINKEKPKENRVTITMDALHF